MNMDQMAAGPEAANQPSQRHRNPVDVRGERVGDKLDAHLGRVEKHGTAAGRALLLLSMPNIFAPLKSPIRDYFVRLALKISRLWPIQGLHFYK